MPNHPAPTPEAVIELARKVWPTLHKAYIDQTLTHHWEKHFLIDSCQKAAIDIYHSGGRSVIKAPTLFELYAKLQGMEGREDEK